MKRIAVPPAMGALHCFCCSSQPKTLNYKFIFSFCYALRALQSNPLPNALYSIASSPTMNRIPRLYDHEGCFISEPKHRLTIEA